MFVNRIDQIKKMLETTPGDDFLKHALALEYLKAGEEMTAKDCFIELLKNNPNYIGSYYHLALLLERLGEREDAIRFFEKGMQVAKEIADNHAFNELRSAYEEMMY